MTNNLQDVETALTTINEALQRNSDETARYRAELSTHEQSLAAAEAELREHALAAKRGDRDAQVRVDASIARMRDSEAATRLLVAALLDLERERSEFQAQKSVASANQLRAQRAEVRERWLSLGKQIDIDGVKLRDAMVTFAKLSQEEAILSKQLNEPQGRALPFAWPLLFGNLFFSVAPALFSIVPPSQREIATFEAVATRTTTEEVAQ
jgi:hypothetical protein